MKKGEKQWNIIKNNKKQWTNNERSWKLDKTTKKNNEKQWKQQWNNNENNEKCR
jgi:hypothetical protein